MIAKRKKMTHATILMVDERDPLVIALATIGAAIAKFSIWATTNIIKALKYIVKHWLILGWVIGLVVLITFCLVYTLLTYPFILWVRIQTKKYLDKAFAQLDTIDERELMELHLECKYIRRSTDKLSRISDGYYVFIPLISEFRKINVATKVAEECLYNRLYPEQAFSEAATKEIKELFEDWREDWEDESLDIYDAK